MKHRLLSPLIIISLTASGSFAEVGPCSEEWTCSNGKTVGPVVSEAACLDACSACQGGNYTCNGYKNATPQWEPPVPRPLNLGSVNTPAIAEACAYSSAKSAINSGDEEAQIKCLITCEPGLCCFSQEEFFGNANVSDMWPKSCYAWNIQKCALYSDCNILKGKEVMEMYTNTTPATDDENVTYHYCQCGAPDANGSCVTTVLTDLCVDPRYYDFASASKVVGGGTFLAAAAVTLSMLALPVVLF